MIVVSSKVTDLVMNEVVYIPSVVEHRIPI